MASAYQFVVPQMGAVAVSNTGTVKLHPLGFLAEAQDPTYGYAEFVYVAGASASTPTAGDACMFLNGSAMQLASGNTASQGPIGIAPAAISGTGVYGWLQVYGVCDYAKIGTQGTAAVGLPLVVGTTAGRLQSTAGATGYVLDGIKVYQYSTTANSNSGIVNLFWPSYNGRNQ